LSAFNASINNASVFNASISNLSAFNASINNASVYNLSVYNSSINLLWGPSCTIPIGGIIMYSGNWPPLDASNNTPYGITNMFSSNRWILCDGGPATAPTFPTPLPSGILNYEYSIPNSTTNVQGKIIITVPNSTITLTIPDLRGRFVMGYIGTSNFAYGGTISSAQTANQQLLAQTTNQTGINIQGVAAYPGGIHNFGGVMTQSIVTTELPSHSHTIPAHSHSAQTNTNVVVTTQPVGGQQNQFVTNVNWTEGDKTGGGQESIVWQVQTTRSAVSFANTTTATSATQISQDAAKNTGDKGSDNPRSNLPPYWVLAYIMRIG
jgi:microcystin-dependent protein